MFKTKKRKALVSVLALVVVLVVVGVIVGASASASSTRKAVRTLLDNNGYSGQFKDLTCPSISDHKGQKFHCTFIASGSQLNVGDKYRMTLTVIGEHNNKIEFNAQVPVDESN